MRSKFLAGAAALALTAGAVMASSTPAAAWRNRAPGPVAAAGAAAGAVLGGALAAATSPWWWGGTYPYGYYGYYPGTYAYAPSYDYGYAAPAWGFGESTNGYVQPEWNGTYGYAAPRDRAWCESRYRSYNPATGMFLGYDGRYHPCP